MVCQMSSGLISIIAPALTRGRTLDANQAGPGDGTMRINALQRLGDPVCLSHDRPQGALPHATASGVAGASSAG